MERQLGKMERGIAFVDDFSSLMIVVVVRLVNGPRPAVLRQTLALLQERHPLLRMRIGKKGRRPCFLAPEDIPPIPLQVDERQDDGQWHAATEEEINQKLDAAAAPLMRVRYLYSPDQAPGEIVFACHHTILDAASGVSLCHELLSLCGTICAGRPVEKPEPLPLVPPADALYPLAFQGAGRLRRSASFLLRTARGEINYRRRLGADCRQSVHTTAHTRILTAQVPPDATGRFVRRARQEGVTLNSALAAAEMLAVGEHLYGGRTFPFRAIAFADLRPHLEPPVAPENLGACFSMLQYTVPMSGRRTLWELAREIHQEIYRMTKHGDKFITPLLTEALFRMMLKQSTFRMCVAGLSYTNVTGLEQSYGPIQVAGLHGFIPNNHLGPEYSIFARLLFDRLWLDVFYMEEDMDRQTAQVVIDKVCHLVGGDE